MSRTEYEQQAIAEQWAALMIVLGVTPNDVSWGEYTGIWSAAELDTMLHEPPNISSAVRILAMRADAAIIAADIAAIVSKRDVAMRYALAETALPVAPSTPSA